VDLTKMSEQKGSDTEADTSFPDAPRAASRGVSQSSGGRQDAVPASTAGRQPTMEQKLRQTEAREAALRQQNRNLRDQIVELVDRVQRLERHTGAPKEATINA